MGTVTSMTKKPTAKPKPKDIHARCFVCLYTLIDIRDKLAKQRADKAKIYAGRLSDATKAYREETRNEENRTATKKVQAKLWIDVMDGVAERDRIDKEKKEVLGEIDKKLKQLDEAEAETFAARRGEGTQAKLFDDDASGTIRYMPWASPGTRKVLYSSLLALETLKVELDDHQRELLTDLAEAETGTIDLGLAATDAIEQDADGDDFEDDEDAPETPPTF